MNSHQTPNHLRLAAIYTRLLPAIAAITLAVSPASRAGLVGPYPVDGNTLHLWHLDETNALGQFFDSVSNNPLVSPMTMSNTPGINLFAPTSFTLAGQPSAFPAFYGYGSSILTTQASCLLAPWFQTNAPSDANTAFPAGPYTNICNFVNTNTGAFTLECLVQPSVNLLTYSAQSTAEIICGDNPQQGSEARGWQWRFNYNSGKPAIEFNDINCPGTNHDLYALLPTSGRDVPAAGNWYHVAVAWTGGQPTNGDPLHTLTVYWTLADPNRTNADILTNFVNAFTFTNKTASGVVNWSANTLTTALYPSNSLHGTPFLAIGGNARGNVTNNVAGAEGFYGNIDEVRISSYYRHSNEFLFNTSPVFEAPTNIAGIPASTFIAYGQTLTLSVSEQGTQPITNQWFQNGVALPGQTNLTLTISNLTFAANGNYQLMATNAYGYGISGTDAVSVGAGFQGLYNTGVDANGNPLDQTAPGSVDLHWQLVQNPDTKTIFPDAIVWGDQSPVAPNGVLPANAASVWIGPEENAGNVAGTYTYQTQFQIDQGDPTTSSLSGNLVASGPAAGGTVQAFVNGVETDVTLPASNPGEHPAPFVITNGLLAGSNTLQMTMVTVAGAGVGGVVGLNVNLSGIGQALPPGLAVITNLLPASLAENVQFGSSAAFSAQAIGRPPLTYQWLLNGAPLDPASFPGANSLDLILNAANGDAPELASPGNYQLAVSDASGSVTSSVVQLTVNLAPVLTCLPATYGSPMTVYAGSSPGFSVAASASIPPYFYQWYSNNVALAGATNASYQLTNLPLGSWGNLECVVTNLYAASTSTVWAVSAIAGPSVPYPQAVVGNSPIGYWRLNEPDDGNNDNNAGVIAHDYVGGNDGIYTNTLLGNVGYTAPPSYSPLDPGLIAPFFGDVALVNSDAYGIAGIDFSSPTNTSQAFTIEAWVNGYPQTRDAGIVSKGYGNGGEQFDLDTGSDSVASHGFRFLIRDASGGSHAVSSTIAPSSGAWYHLAGVVDEANSNMTFYINGLPVGTAAIAPGSGILASSDQMAIGSRYSTLATSLTNDLDDQFVGFVNDVAVYNYALSASQVLNEYFSAGVPPIITLQPVATTNVNQGSTLVVPAAALGNAPVTYSWFDENIGNYIPGETNAVLVISNIQNSDTYYLTATDPYGATNSNPVTVNVNAGLNVNLGPASLTIYAGMTMTYSAVATGTEPFYYQWLTNGVNVPNQTSSTYSLVAPLGGISISCTVTNPYNGYSSVTAGPVTLTGIAAPSGLYQIIVLSNNPVAYWRLNETDDGLNDGNPGATAYDYVGGHNAAYNNVELGLPGFNPAEQAALFGVFAPSNCVASEVDNSANGLANIDFSTPAGGNAEFSVEAWVNSTNAAQIGGAGIVAKGYGHSEQFDLDMSGNAFRFFVRDAAGNVHGPTSTFVPVVGQWYHVVAVWDGAAGAAHLYVNGTDIADTTGVASGAGLFATTSSPTLPSGALVNIGARTSANTVSYYDYQFQGKIDDVALYNRALSASQVLADFNAAGLVNTMPTNIVVSVSGNQLVLAWPQDHTGWRLQAQTNNLNVGLSTNWSTVANSTGTNQVVMPITSTSGSVFYRLVYP